MGWFREKRGYGPSGRERELPLSQKIKITEAQRLKKNVIFHGACIGCIWLEGNSTGENLRYCMGCAFSTFADHLPNRRIKLADDRDFANADLYDQHNYPY